MNGSATARRASPTGSVRADGGIVAFAALMETYAEPGGSEIDTAAILTTGAGYDTAFIHDRAPVVIAPRDYARWLDCRTQEPRDVADLLRPADDGFFEAIPVSDRVNKVANTGPELLDKVAAVTNDEPKPKEFQAAKSARSGFFKDDFSPCLYVRCPRDRTQSGAVQGPEQR